VKFVILPTSPPTVYDVPLNEEPWCLPTDDTSRPEVRSRRLIPQEAEERAVERTTWIATFILYIFRETILYSPRIKTKLLHSTPGYISRSPTRFGLINLSSSWNHLKRFFNLELSHVVTSVVVFMIIKIIKIGL